MNQLRRCTFETTKVENSKVIITKNEGYFHTWGMDAIEDGREGHGNIMWSVGIVEDENGNNLRISVDKIKFTDKP